MDLREEVKQISKTLSCIESELNCPEFNRVQQQYAIKNAFKNKKWTERIKLFIEILLKKMGRIPEYPVDSYRTDIVIRQKIQELKTRMVLLEYFQTRMPEIKTEKYSSPQTVRKILREIPIAKLKKGYVGFVVESLDKGGLEQVVALLATEFQRREIQVKIFCLDKGGFIAEQLRDLGIEIYEFYNNGGKLKKYIKDNPPILVNTHHVKKYVKFFYEKKIPVVEVIHNMYVYYCDHMVEVERRNEQYYTRLIAVSEVVKDTYMEKIKTSDKITVIGNAAMIREAPQKNREEVRIDLGISADGIVLLNVGSIDRRKNQLGIISAFDVVSKIVNMPIYLVFAGNVQDEEYYAKVLEVMNRCKAREKIKLLPYYGCIRELYQMADVFILDSFYEGWSIAATEALYEGIPVIHSMCGSAKELTQNGRYGVMISNPAGKLDEMSNEDIIKKINRFEFENTGELVNAILEIVNGLDNWKSNRSILMKETRLRYSVDAMVEGYLETFEEIAG